MALAEEKLALVVSYTRTIKNAHTRVCQLPGDVLDMIFMLTARQDPSFLVLPHVESDLQQSPQDNVWHPSLVTGVCRYWRAITLSRPSIWSTIYLNNDARNASLELAQLCLRRSYGTSLKVYILNTSPLPEKTLSWISETLAAQSIRFQGLHLCGPDVEERLLEIFLECPAPQLQHLTIQPLSHNERYKKHGALCAQLPAIFAGFLPQLQSFTIEHFTSWPTHRLQTLTHLCIQYPKSPIEASDLLEFMGDNPMLQSLVLLTNQPTQDDDSIEPFTVLPLPHLRHIYIDAGYTTSFVSRVLNHVRPSPTASLQLYHARGGTSNSLLTTLLRLPSVSNISSLRLSTHSSGTPAARRLRISAHGAASFDILQSADVHEIASNQYMAALVALLTTCKPRELWLEDYDEVVAREPLWQRVLFALPLVTKLVLGPWTHRPDAERNDACLSALNAADETRGRALPCPELEELVVLGDLLKDAWLSVRIHTLLQIRKARGFPVKRLVIVAPRPRPKADPTLYGAAFKQLVHDVRVEWVDGEYPRFPVRGMADVHPSLGAPP